MTQLSPEVLGEADDDLPVTTCEILAETKRKHMLSRSFTKSEQRKTWAVKNARGRTQATFVIQNRRNTAEWFHCSTRRQDQTLSQEAKLFRRCTSGAYELHGLS